MQLNILTLFFLLYAVAAVPVNSPVKNSLAPKGSTTGKGAPQKGCSPCVKKREQHGPVASALLATKSLIGKGDFGQAWSTKFNGQDAVIKVMHTPEAAKVEHEVRCLKAVKQFLGWGRTADSSHFYIVMRNMGKPLLVAAPLADGALDDIHEIRKLQSAAKSHYEKTYHMRHLDTGTQNYVFHEEGGRWKAELIDWGLAEPIGSMKLPAAGQPEIVTHHEPIEKSRKCCCNCLIM